MRNGYFDEIKKKIPKSFYGFYSHIRDLFDTCFPIKKIKLRVKVKHSA